MVINKKKAWEMCNKCGDYEYCAGKYGTDECTGFISGNNVIPGYGQSCEE